MSKTKTWDCDIGCTVAEVRERLGTGEWSRFLAEAMPRLEWEGVDRLVCDGSVREIGKADLVQRRCGQHQKRGGHGIVYPRGWVDQWAATGRLPKEPWT